VIRELRAARSESHRYDLIMRSAHPFDVGEIRWQRARRDPFVIGVAGAEDRSEARVLEPADGFIGVVGRVVVVRPVIESRDARIERLERPKMVGDIHVVGSLDAAHDATNP
jgi:hypothetical protein